jgi:hypothetical protein
MSHVRQTILVYVVLVYFDAMEKTGYRLLLLRLRAGPPKSIEAVARAAAKTTVWDVFRDKTTASKACNFRDTMTTKRHKPPRYEFRLRAPGEPSDIAAAIRRLEKIRIENLLREYLSGWVRPPDDQRNDN